MEAPGLGGVGELPHRLDRFGCPRDFPGGSAGGEEVADAPADADDRPLAQSTEAQRAVPLRVVGPLHVLQRRFFLP
jgi:hypothetical protein